MSENGAKRTQTDLLVEILEFCRIPARKTRIMYQANMSYTQLLASVERLQNCGLLRFDADTKNYSTTEKGLEFLQRYAAVLELLKP